MEEEQAKSLMDLFFRRTDMGWDLDQGRAKLESAAKDMAEVMGWNDTEIQEQSSSYVLYIEELFPHHH